MKHIPRFLLLMWFGLAASPCVTGAPATEPAAPAITERGAHHRVWSRTHIITLPDGRARTNTISYTELGSGMHRWDAQAGAWTDAEAVIEIVGNSAVAGKTAHQVTFAANANTPGAIDLITPDGKRLRSHVLGIAWFDAASGRSEMIAELKNSIGEVHAPNVVIYPDAFDGLVADLRYTVRLGGFEQDVILRERPALPAGFAPDTTRLEVWTEFIEAPGAFLTQRGVAGMTDDTLDFGAMQTGAGTAFTLSDEPQPRRSALVTKRWLVAEGRTFLVEAVRYPSAKPDLDKLPAPQAKAAPRAPHPQHAAGRPFPPAPATRQARANPPGEGFRMAALPGGSRGHETQTASTTKGVTLDQSLLTSAATNASLAPRISPLSPRLGYVIDYTLNGSLTNFTFQCDTTYYASNTVNFYGATTFEGGTVVKFAKTNTASLVLGAPDWRTAQYRPAIFTAKDDNTVGEIISGSTGTPSGYYGGAYLDITSGNGTNTHLRVSQARTAIKCAGNFAVRHAQFLSCSNAFDQSSIGSLPRLTLENVLLYGIQNVAVLGVVDSVGYFTGTHLTLNSCGMLTTNTTGAFNWVGELNNSIIFGLGGWGGGEEEPSLNACYTDLLGEETSPFQTVGAAAHYLTVASGLRDEGNALSGALAEDLKKRTTWPPLVISNQVLNSGLTLTPQAQRDETSPDLGYHYDPIDFALGQVTLSNAVLTAAHGVVIATFAPANAKAGVALVSNASFLSEGSPTNLNRVVRYNTVQEQVNTLWTNQPGPQVQAIDSATVRLRFTGFSGAAQDTTHFSGDENSGGSFPFRDCEFGGGRIAGLQPNLHFTNCLFQRVNHELSSYNSPFNVSYQNCLFHGGRLSFEDGGGGIGLWAFHNNLFAGTTNLTNGVLVTNSHNAYTTNLALLVPTASTNVLLATNALAFDTGPLGFFYLPTIGPATNLFNKGSTYATNVGLYHFTTTTNQWKETNSIVDIGFHYVAVGTNGLPVDTDIDGLPDYVEDANGNGSLDHRETKPNDAADRGLRVFITRPRTGSTIP